MEQYKNPPTPLLELLRECTADDREWLAESVGTSVNYLYSLAGCHRSGPSAELAFALEDASRDLRKKTRGRTRVLKARDVAGMCAMRDLGL